MAAAPASARNTVLGIEGTRFTLNGSPVFLLGISYYGGLGAPREMVGRDLDAMQKHGFNWLRLWAVWSYREEDVSAVDPAGQPREPFISRLKYLVEECDRRKIVVDVTLTRGRNLPDMQSHRAAVRTLVRTLSGCRNWYLDLANEQDVRDARYVPVEELRELRELARGLAPDLPVTASFGGHDLDEKDFRAALNDARLDFLAPHRPRHAGSPGETQEHTRRCLAIMRRIGRVVPIHYQEPFRRGYGDWQPKAEDFAEDLQGAKAGGAAGWCLHNGDRRAAADGRPRRSFDLRERSLFEQLDDEERRFLQMLLSPAAP